MDELITQRPVNRHRDERALLRRCTMQTQERRKKQIG